MRRTGATIAVAVLALVAAVACRAQTGGLLDLDQFPRSQLAIHSGTHEYQFDVWVALTPQQQEQGLMFVRDLPENRGMLFVAREPRIFNMWMKNTYIELDMVFVGTDGRIAKIAERTTPHSLATISSDRPAAAILELRGGEAARRGLKVGDRVSWSQAKAG